MDLFATALALGGAPSAQDVRIDGQDLSPLLLHGQEQEFFERGLQKRSRSGLTPSSAFAGPSMPNS